MNTRESKLHCVVRTMKSGSIMSCTPRSLTPLCYDTTHSDSIVSCTPWSLTQSFMNTTESNSIVCEHHKVWLHRVMHTTKSNSIVHEHHGVWLNRSWTPRSLTPSCHAHHEVCGVKLGSVNDTGESSTAVSMILYVGVRLFGVNETVDSNVRTIFLNIFSLPIRTILIQILVRIEVQGRSEGWGLRFKG